MFIYYRPSLLHSAELIAAKKSFICNDSLIDLYDEAQYMYKGQKKFLIPRYSILPFLNDIYNEFFMMSDYLKPINNLDQVKYVADLSNWVEDLGDLTPKTWSSNDLAHLPENTQFVLKGATNSKKNYWNTHMFAKNKQEAIETFCRLSDDCLISTQDIYIREYVPLKTYMIGINDLPITKEFRLFFYKDKLLAADYYWQNYVDDLEEKPKLDVDPAFIKQITDRLEDHINFYVVDIAQKEDGNWIVIELNSGEMSGLSCIDPNILYQNLHKVLYDK